ALAGSASRNITKLRPAGPFVPRSQRLLATQRHAAFLGGLVHDLVAQYSLQPVLQHLPVHDGAHALRQKPCAGGSLSSVPGAVLGRTSGSGAGRRARTELYPCLDAAALF